MINTTSKHQKSKKEKYPFCILIPSWNNLGYLKLCIRSIKENSHFENQIIVIANEASDGTIQWLENQDEIDYIHAENNIGICYGLNSTRSLIKSDYLVYVNDDMYLLPDWDLELFKEIESIGNKEFMLSSTMIEPYDTKNPCVLVKDYGRSIEDFKEVQLLADYKDFKMNDWSGSTWPPNVVHIDLWDLVGGMSIEFSPGMYSDPDFSRKLFEAGVRIFKGKGSSFAYHFGSKSTGRIKKNNGRKVFLMKWGITPKRFTDKYLQRGKRYSTMNGLPKFSCLEKMANYFKKLLSC